MRKQVQLGFLAILILGIVGGVYFWSNSTVDQQNTFAYTHISPKEAYELRESAKDIKHAIGDVRENINARDQFDRLRLQNPTTGQIPENIKQRTAAFAMTLPDFNPANKRLSVGDFNFSHRGPDNVGGRTRALALDINDENIILAGGVSGGMWKSTDLGETWTRTTRLDQFPSVTCVAQDIRAGHTNTWYYGTGEIRGNSASAPGALYRGDGIYKSTNGGDSWELIASTSTGGITSFNSSFKYVNNIAIDPSNLAEAEVYAAAYGGIYRSTDGFETFELVLGEGINSSGGRFTDVAVTSTGVVYATISNTSGSTTTFGIFRSEDGIDWTKIPADLPANVERIKIAISPSHEAIVYFLTPKQTAGGNDSKLYKYHAEREEMLDRSSSINTFFGVQGSYNLVLGIHPNDTNTVYIGDTNLYRSKNGFESDAQTTHIGGYGITTFLYPQHHPDQQNFVFLRSNPDIMISSHDGGVSITQNNLANTVNWDFLNNAYQTTQFYALAMQQHTDDPLVLGGTQDNSTWGVFGTDANNEWQDLFSGDGSFCATTPSNIVVSAQTAYAQAIILNEETGNIVDNGRIDPQGAGSDFLFINPLIIDNANTDRIYMAARNRILFSDNVDSLMDNFGEIPAGSGIFYTPAWEEIATSRFTGNVTALATTPELPTNSLLFAVNDNLYKLTDPSNPSLSTFTNLTGANFPSNGYINCIAIDPNDVNSLFVVFTNYGILSVFHSTDGGENWTPVSGNLEENPDGSGAGLSTTWLSILPSGDANSYLLGTNMGLYFTTEIDGMNTTWEQIGADVIGNVKVDMVESRAVDGRIVVGTHGNGIYQAYVNVPFRPRLHSENGTTVCSGEFILRAPKKAGYDYQWFKDNAEIDFATSHKYAGTESGDYFCVMTNQSTSETVHTDTVSAGQVAEPDLTITIGDNTLSIPECTGCTYQWYAIAEGRITGATSNILTFENTGLAKTYMVEVSNNCFTRLRSELVVASLDDDVQANRIGLEVYPNPATITTNLKYFLPEASEVSFNVIDNSGKVVKTINAASRSRGIHEQKLSLTGLAKGTYIIQIQSTAGTTTSRLLIP